MEKTGFEQRVGRIKTAIALGQPDRVPLAPYFDGAIERLCGSSYKDIFYDFDKAGEAAIEFLKKYPQVDCTYVPGFTSGLANELAGTRWIDWPGRPGTKVSDFSTFQVIEIPFMEQDEYPELLKDYTGFMLRKFIPRAFSNLQGLSRIAFDDCIFGLTTMLSSLQTPEFFESVELLRKIAAEDEKAMNALFKYSAITAKMGYPGIFGAFGEVPYDVLSDFYRGTVGIFEDILDEDTRPYVEDAVWMFADKQIAYLQYLKDTDMPIKTCMFALHKGMDGFMSDEQYAKLYWAPFKKILMALIDIGVTPYIYTEGPYDTRLEYLADLPKGKCLIHFEKVDMKRAKEIVGKNSCICGNLSVSQLEFGTKEQVIDETKALLETCMPGGGYIFDFNGSLQNAKEENLDAMFETLDQFGRY